MKLRPYTHLQEQQWLEGLAGLDTFVSNHGHARVPTAWVAPNGHRTGGWLVRVRAQARAGQLGVARLTQLNERGVNPDRSQDIFDEWLSALDEYIAAHYDTNVSQHYVDPKGRKLGQWLTRQRRHLRNGILDANRQQSLTARGVDHDPQDTSFRNALAEMDIWGSVNVTQKTITDTGFPLGVWLTAQRHRHRLGMLTAERVRELEGRGIIWDVREESFHAGLKELDEHLCGNEELAAYRGLVTATGFPLGNWLQSRRAQHKKGALSREHLRELRDREIEWAQ